MGCDIHVVLERKHKGRWVAANTCDDYDKTRGRNYTRFAALAGVRGEGPEPRGLPEWPSDTTQMLLDDWGCDAHSVSWLPLAEAAKIWLETDYRPTEFARQWPGSHYFGVDENEEDYRVIFWFDN